MNHLHPILTLSPEERSRLMAAAKRHALDLRRAAIADAWAAAGSAIDAALRSVADAARRALAHGRASLRTGS